ncbi:MAG: hypothetical protein ABI559_08405 [Chloroflexota bacterium]
MTTAGRSWLERGATNLPKTQHYWEVWYPRAGATGLLVARGQIDPTERIILHAAPEFVTVEVYDNARHTIARGEDLPRTADTPMCLLRIEHAAVMREDIWPSESHLGSIVLLAGGEAGVLKSWWNAGDRSEWRWQLELYNSRK